MKKIGICTLHDAYPNFGALLQAYAMQEVLKDLGYDVEFLKFKDDTNKELLRIKRLLHKVYKNEAKFKKISMRYTGVDTKNIVINSKLKISRKHLNISSKIYDPEEKFDSILVGSDELWNINNPSFEHRREYYGHDLGSNNIFTYAPSCNTTTIEEFNKFHNNKIDFSMFKNLSARDLNTKKLLEEISKRDVTLVLDPTMLYENMMLHAVDPKEKGYILIYDYRVTEKRKKQIQQLAKEKNLPIYSIGFYCDFADKNIDADIFEFMGYMKNASYVVTATFHGTIFSILSKRQFVSCASLGYKIQDLLKRFELEDRDSSESDNIIEMIDKKIDYDKVERLLKEKRKESMDYLTKALKGE